MFINLTWVQGLGLHVGDEFTTVCKVQSVRFVGRDLESDIICISSYLRCDTAIKLKVNDVDRIARFRKLRNCSDEYPAVSILLRADNNELILNIDKLPIQININYCKEYSLTPVVAVYEISFNGGKYPDGITFSFTKPVVSYVSRGMACIERYSDLIKKIPYPSKLFWNSDDTEESAANSLTIFDDLIAQARKELELADALRAEINAYTVEDYLQEKERENAREKNV